MSTIPNRGRGGGDHRSRGRGRGNFGGPNPDEGQSGFGRGAGRGQGDRGGRGGHHGEVHVMGRISDDEKKQIREATRPTAIQVSSEGTDDIIVASPANEVVRHFAHIVLTKPEFTKFQSLGQFRRFVNSCLLNLSNHHSVDTSDLLSALTSPQGLERLKDILIMPMNIDAANIYGTLSFQFVILPLVGVLTRESVCQLAMDGATNAIYATVYTHRQNFIKGGIIPNMKRLLERGSLKDRSPAATQIQREDEYLCVVPSLSCAYLAIVRLIYQIVIRVRDARIDLARTVRTLLIQVHTCAKNFNETEWDRRVNAIMVQEVKRLQRIVSDAEDAVVPLLDVTVADPGAGSDSAHSKTQLRHSFHPPGKRSANGPSHDNDHVEISEINILPTQLEITCSRPPFLPSNGVPDAPHFLAHGWKRQVDTHFRLYREDMMDPFRRSMNSFLAVLRHTPFGEEDRLLDNKELRKVIPGHVSLNVYGNVEVSGMIMDKNTGGNIELGFSQPPQILGTANKNRRTEFWERSKNRLMHGGLVCLVGRDQGALGSRQDASAPNIQLIVAVNTRRDTESLAKDDKVAQISITLADPLQYLLLLSSGKHWLIVESPGTDFGSYRPILKALQHTIPASLPFGKYLAPTVEEQAKIKNVKNHVDPPIYTRAPTFQFDLSVLLNGRKWRLDVNNTISIEKTIGTLQKYSTLDYSQSKALVETLCREVALIHAPPGTGRTLIGISLVEVLRVNKVRSECGPVLYICSTDDALDRFLEQCLDKGVIDIVRVGSGSMSKRLEQYNLEALLNGFIKPYQVEQDSQEATSDLDSDAKKIGSLERTLKGDFMQWNHVQNLLEQNYPDMYKQFGKVSNDAHQTSDDKVNKDEHAKHSFDRWRSGQDIQEKTAHSEEAKNMLESNATDPESSPPDCQKIPSNKRSVDLLLDCNIWDMSMSERRRLLDQWRPKVQGNLMAQLGGVLKHVETLNDKKNGAMDEIRRRILRQCSVVGMTTAGAAESQELIRKLAPKIIIYEEAGQVLESHIISTLAPSTQHLILIGDHRQLRPRIETYGLSSDSPIGKKYNLDMSLFERLSTSATNPLPMSVLTTQTRMRPCIADLIRPPLYPMLEYGDNTHSYPPVCGMGESLYFMNHDHPENAKVMNGVQSYSSTFEADMVKALATYLTKNGYDQLGDIVILTPYLGQLSQLREALKSKYVLVINGSDQEQLDQAELEEVDENQKSVHVQGGTAIGVNSDSTQKQLTLSTVDNWQGEEAKIVIISLVRNKEDNDSSVSEKIGFLKSPNRTNVLLSRAQHGMFIIGNADLMEREKSGIWPSVIKELRIHNRIGAGLPLVCKNHPEQARIVESDKHLNAVAPDGGCALSCGRGMPCGHICPRLCHLEDVEHRLVKCYRPCDRLLPGCLHVCQRQCGESCGDCMELVGSIALACGHTFEKPTCHQKNNPATIVCKTKIARKSPTCEHQHDVECCDKGAKVVCSQFCGSELPCGHRCTNTCLTCQKGTQHSQCKLKCDKGLFCGHSCDAPCHPDSDCPPCQQSCAVACAHRTCHLPCGSACAACSESCVWECEHQGRCNMPCGVPCDRLPCNKRCTEKLSCGHRCPSVCGEACPPQKFCVECKDPETMAMQVDKVNMANLGNTDVNVNPIMVFSCGHALTMATLDGMMEMGAYYEKQADDTAKETIYVAKKSLPGSKAKQVSCPSCRKPVVELLRYGRRIKDAQLSIRLKKYQIIQENDMTDIKIQLDVASAQLEKGNNGFVLALCKVRARNVDNPPLPETRKLGKLTLESSRIPNSDFSTIAETYDIPPTHRALWLKHIQPVVKVVQELDEINKKAARPPTKQVFEAAVSRLFRLKDRRLYAESTDKDAASAIINECIRNCGVTADGNVGPSYVESLAEKTNALLLVLSKATATMESIGPMTGWYWFVEDLLSCCSVYNNITMEAALKGSFDSRVAYSRVTLLQIMCSRFHWMGLRQLPDNEADKEVRLGQVEKLMERFTLEKELLNAHCPDSIKNECLDRVERIEEKMVMAVKMARGELPLNPGLTKAEKISVRRAIATTLIRRWRMWQGHANIEVS